MSEINFLIRKYVQQYEAQAPASDTIDVDAVAREVTDALLDSADLRNTIKALVTPAVRQLLRVQSYNSMNKVGRTARRKEMEETRPVRAKAQFVPATRINGAVIIPSAVGKKASTLDNYFQVDGKSRKFGSLNITEVLSLVVIREEKAKQNQAKANQLRAVAQLMDERGANIVYDLGEEAVLNAFDGAEISV